MNLLKPVLRKHARMKSTTNNNNSTSTSSSSATASAAAAAAVALKTSWRPRPSILHARLEADSFAPGVDPLNYFEQDKRLGYQKLRMWFPGAAVGAATSLVPDERSGPGASGSGTSSKLKRNTADSEQVVKEFLQMRALASYVGDLVTPFTAAGGKASYLTMRSATATPNASGEGWVK